MDIEISNSNPITLTINDNNNNSNSKQSNTRSILEKKILLAFKSIRSKDIILQLISSSKVLLTLLKQQINQKQIISNAESKNINAPIITQNIIEKLRRISLRNMLDVNIQIGKIYEILLRESYHSLQLSNDIKILIEISNEVISILTKLKGTKVYHLLRKECYSYLQLILKDTRLNEDQSESIKEELNRFTYINDRPIMSNSLNSNDAIVESININTSNKSNLLYHHCLDALMKMEYTEEGYQYLALYGYEIYKSILSNPDINHYQLYLNIGKILANYLLSPQYRLVSFQSSYTKTEVSHINIYQDSESSLNINCNNINQYIANYTNKNYEVDIHFKHIEDLFDICYFFLSSVITVLTINELSDIFFLLMKRLYFTWQSKTKNLFGLIIHFYSIYSKCPIPKQYQKFLKYLLSTSYLLENNILREELLKLYPQYRYSDSMNIDNDDDIQSEEIDIFSINQISFGYNCRCNIEPGNQWSILIEIEKAMSILHLWLMIEYYDITIQLMKYIHDNDSDSNKGFVLMKQFEKVKAGYNGSEKNFELIYLLAEPGIYKIIFDNSNSWFKSKDISYKIKVLKPIVKISNSISYTNSNSNWEQYADRYHYILNSNDKSMISLLAIKENIIQCQMNSIVIPLLYDTIHKVISIYNRNTNSSDVLIELINDNKIPIQMIIYNALKKYYSYYNNLAIFKDKSIIINCFIMESSINGNKTIGKEDVVDLYSITNDDDDTQFRNITLNYFNLAHSCIEYILYQKSIHYERNNSILHLHITSTSFYPYFYNANDSNKHNGNLFEYNNAHYSILSFIGKIQSIYKGFGVNLTYSDIDFQFVNRIRESIKSNSKDIIEVYIYDYVYFNNVLHMTHVLNTN